MDQGLSREEKKDNNNTPFKRERIVFYSSALVQNIITISIWIVKSNIDTFREQIELSRRRERYVEEYFVKEMYFGSYFGGGGGCKWTGRMRKRVCSDQFHMGCQDVLEVQSVTKCTSLRMLQRTLFILYIREREILTYFQ